MRFSSRSARQLALAAGVLGFASLTACNKGGGDFAKTKSGIEYKIFKKVGNSYERREIGPDGDPTYKDRVGKFLLGYMEYRTGKDSVLQNTRADMGMAVPLPLQELKQKGMPDEALSLLQPGDSGVFRFQVDSLIKPKSGQKVPPFLKRGGNTVQMFVSTTPKLVTEAEAQALQPELQKRSMVAQMKKRMASPEFNKQLQAQKEAQAKMLASPEVVAQMKKDDAVLQDYIKKNGLTVQKTPSGVYYQVLKPGTGATPKTGQTVSVNYNGTLLSGKLFDSSDKQGRPIDFPIGLGQVIPGWDEGLAMLNKGSKAILLIPSPLAYGPRGAGADIPANSPLRFEVELVGIE
jgi:FKBP-type peptidyl-prolyl cis-trans isomerase FkpA